MNTVKLGGRNVNVDSLRVHYVCEEETDLCGCCFDYGEYANGQRIELRDLDDLTLEYPELLKPLAFARYTELYPHNAHKLTFTTLV